MLAVLEAVNGIMDELGLNYEVEEWSGENTYPYWVLKYLGNYHRDEGGRSEHYPTLTGHSIEETDNWLTLLKEAEKIENYLKNGVSYICEDGNVVFISIQDINIFPSQIPSHKEIEISLNIRTWEVN